MRRLAITLQIGSSVIVLILMVPFIIILFALCFMPTRDFTMSEPFHGLRRFGVAGFLLDKLAQFSPDCTSLTDSNQAKRFSPLGFSPLPDRRIAESV